MFGRQQLIRKDGKNNNDMKNLIKLWKDSYWLPISVACLIFIPIILFFCRCEKAAKWVFIFGVAHFIFALAYAKYLKLKGK